jgi:hypothetical protein
MGMKIGGKMVNHPERQITDLKEIEEILRNALVGRLGMCKENSPYVTPMVFVYHDGKIYLHSSSRGKKIEYLRANPNVCFEVDDASLVPAPKPCDFSMRYRSVIAYGRARFLEKLEEKILALKRLMEKYDPEHKSLPLSEKMVAEMKPTVIEITIREMTGKKNIP